MTNTDAYYLNETRFIYKHINKYNFKLQPNQLM